MCSIGKSTFGKCVVSANLFSAYVYYRQIYFRQMCIIGKSIFGKSIFGKSIFGKSIFGKSIFGKSVLGKSGVGKLLHVYHLLISVQQMWLRQIRQSDYTHADSRSFSPFYKLKRIYCLKKLYLQNWMQVNSKRTPANPFELTLDILRPLIVLITK